MNDAGTLSYHDSGSHRDAGRSWHDDGWDAGVDYPANDAGFLGHAIDGGVDAGSEQDGCPDSLDVSPEVAYAEPWGMVNFVVLNGTGPFRFLLKEGMQYGAINYVLGRYTAGVTTGVSDIVEIIDEGCGLKTERIVNIVDPISINPANLWMPPGVSVEINAAGGSGNFVFEVIFNEAGGSVDPITGIYEAPTWDGVGNPPYGFDRVLVTDSLGGSSAILEIIIDVDAQLTADPARVALPLGATYQIAPTGGSGSYRLDIDQEGLVYDGERLHGAVSGSYAVDILDKNTGLTTAMTVDVIQGQQADIGLLGGPAI